MKTLLLTTSLILLCSCASKRTAEPLTRNPVDVAFQQQRQEAGARARITGDNRPYPEGWVGLPRNPNPKIAESIHLGQTTNEVASIMGREGWSHNTTRNEFLKRLRTVYSERRGSHKEPLDIRGFDERLPIEGRYFYWQYQGFSSTADWVVIFFAPMTSEPDDQPRVVARGVFGLGDY